MTDIPARIGEGLTFEKVWASLQEMAKKSDKEFAELRKSQRETDKKFQETGKYLKALGEKMGYLDSRFGELAEHLVLPSILDKFNSLGFDFVAAFSNLPVVDTETKKTIGEIDILLRSSSLVMVVEVKAKPSHSDINKHIKHMDYFRNFYTEYQNYKVCGAAAGAIFPEKIKEYAFLNGLYVIEQSGDTVKIDIPPNFKPREW